MSREVPIWGTMHVNELLKQARCKVKNSLHDNTVPAYPILNKSIENVVMISLTVNAADDTKTAP